VWLTVASVGGRAIGLVGTLAITRLVSYERFGEVADAAILAMTASWLSSWGFGQYAIVKGRGEMLDEVTWHATVAYLGLGAIALGAVAMFGGELVGILRAPGAAAYVPYLALAYFIRRIGAMPERVLMRELRFGASAVSVFAGEVAYAVTAIGLACAGHGAWAIVYANLVQAIAISTILLGAAGITSWATPTRLRLARFVDMLHYGVPLGVVGFAHQGSRYWDNLAISHFFGAGAAGAYQLAYNLADIPATQIGEPIAGVLTPSLAELAPEQRMSALERSTALLSLIVFPLAIGLGVVADPLIGLVLPANEWQLAAPFLAVLACVSVFRPITWVIASYFEVTARTVPLMVLEVGKVVLLIGGIALLAPLGPIAACGAVGIAFGLSAIGGVILVMRDGPSPRRLLVGFVQPLGACAVMVVAALGARAVVEAGGVGGRAITLLAMVVAGAAAYIVSALVLAPATSRELWRLVRRALNRTSQ
jgi:lipopolysaccharide exporter